jgi:hypothetical protein
VVGTKKEKPKNPVGGPHPTFVKQPEVVPFTQSVNGKASGDAVMVNAQRGDASVWFFSLRKSSDRPMFRLCFLPNNLQSWCRPGRWKTVLSNMNNN